jgi:hypothetical protein
MKKWLALLLLIPAAVFGRYASPIITLPFSNGFGATVYQAKTVKRKFLYLYDHLLKRSARAGLEPPC